MKHSVSLNNEGRISVDTTNFLNVINTLQALVADTIGSDILNHQRHSRCRSVNAATVDKLKSQTFPWRPQ